MVLVSRLSVLLAGVIGVLVAIIQPPKVFDLVVFAFGTLGNSFMVPYIAAVYWKNANKAGVLSSMIAGGTSNILWTSFGWESVTGIHPFLAGLIISIIAMLIGNRFGTPPSERIQEIFEEAKGERLLPKNVEKNISKDIGPEAKVISVFLKEGHPVRG